MLKSGQSIYYRLANDFKKYTATVVSSDESGIGLRLSKDRPAVIPDSEYIIVSCDKLDYFTRPAELQGEKLKLKLLWSEKREYFRVDDVLPVAVRKQSNEAALKSVVTPRANVEITGLELSDDKIHPKIIKLLLEMNNKLNILIESLSQRTEDKAQRLQNKKVNISASGMCFTVDEKVDTGDTIEVKMFLPTVPPVEVLTYGMVVRAKAIGNNQYEVAVHFHDMEESVRDEIIQYALNRQREAIKIQRKGNDV